MPRQPSKKSTDPVQQALRDHKKEWNANCSEIIGQLIALKRGLNGKGDAKIGLPPSSIKDQLPGEVSGLLSQLAGEFQSLVGGAQGIIQEQSAYSKNRRKPRAKGVPQGQAAPPPPANATPTQTEQAVENLGRMGQATYELEALGSNPLSRTWAYLSSIFSRKEFRRERMGLLSITANLYKHLLDLENHVLMLNKHSIPQSISKYQLAKYKVEALKRSFMRVEQLLLDKAKEERPQQEETIQEPRSRKAPTPEAPKEPTDPIDKVSQMIVKLINDGADRKFLDPIINFIGDYETETNPRTKRMMAAKIVGMFEKAVARLTAKTPDVKANIDPEGFVKVATNPMGRWLRRQLVKAMKFNRTAGPRLDVVSVLDDVKANVKQLMSELEGDNSIEELGKLIVEISRGIEEMGKPMGILSLIFQDVFYEEQKSKPYDSWRGRPMGRGKGRVPEYSDRFLDYLTTRKLRRDLSKDLV